MIHTLEEREGLRTFHSRNSHPSAGVAGGTGRIAGIAQEQIRLYYSQWGGVVKESIETLGAPVRFNTFLPYRF